MTIDQNIGHNYYYNESLVVTIDQNIGHNYYYNESLVTIDQNIGHQRGACSRLRM